MADIQTIPARHGVATFVPAGQIIKIINTSGTQVVDTWAFALPAPEPKDDSKNPGAGSMEQDAPEENAKQPEQQSSKSKSTPVKKGKKGQNVDLPSQEDAEKATQEALKEGDGEDQDSPQKSSWGSYVPSLGFTPSKKGKRGGQDGGETEQQKNSRTWASYFPSGKGFTNYVPKAATDTMSGFAAMHQRDPGKTYLQQLHDFSRTPVGAAGMAAITGSGYAGSMYAGYQAWAMQNPGQQMMEYLSMPHTHTSTMHLRPRVNDTLVSNIREPMLTLVEDSSSGNHDTLIAACDPQRYRGLGVAKWEEHGSCAENLVLALKELNERAGLKGAKAVGASITMNSVPAPLNLFMNIPWDDDGDLGSLASKCKPEDFVRFKAERDVVVVMSACPQDVTEINSKDPTDAHFIVETDEPTRNALRRTAVQQPRKQRLPPKKVGSSQSTTTGSTTANAPKRGPTPQKKPLPQSRAPAAKRASDAAAASTTAAKQTQPAKKKPVPRPVAPQRQLDEPTSASASGANGDSASTPAKKKPRKLNAKTPET